VAVDGEELRLTGDDVELRFRPIPPVPTSELVGTEWLLHTLVDDETASSVLAEPVLWLDPDGTVSGGTGCRSFSATWTVRGELVVFEDLVVEGQCTPDLESQDAHVISVLGDGFQVGIDGDLLTALDPDGRGLIYRDKG
jgi:heat shock protein HslJ